MGGDPNYLLTGMVLQVWYGNFYLLLNLSEGEPEAATSGRNVGIVTKFLELSLNVMVHSRKRTNVSLK